MAAVLLSRAKRLEIQARVAGGQVRIHVRKGIWRYSVGGEWGEKPGFGGEGADVVKQV